jgi:hypothetical protein
VSVFQPSRRVRDPGGREWEIYAFRIRLPERDPPRDSAFEYTRLHALGAVLWLLGQVPRLLVRVFYDVPLAALRALRSDEWTIEAIAWLPHKTIYIWTTTHEYRGHVLAQVEGELARGDIPHPHHAVFHGVRD